MESTLIVIDARSREQEVFSASATELPNGGLVLRKGVRVGTVKELHGQTLEFPILVVGDYQARSSAGYVSLIGGEAADERIWVGGAGFGFTDHYASVDGSPIHRGYGLRPFGWPLEAVLIPAGVRVEKVQMHQNSNPATAAAAHVGLQLKVSAAGGRLLILAEGQSDYTSATSFEVPEGVVPPEFPREHRAEDVFSSENVFDAAMRRLAGRDEGRQALMTAVMRAAYRAGEDGARVVRLPETVHDLLGNEEIARIAEDVTSSLEEDEWRFGFDMSLGSHFTRAVSPDGGVTDWNSISASVEFEFAELSTLNSAEEIREMRISSRAGIIGGSLSEAVDYWEGRFAVLSEGDFLLKITFQEGAIEELWLPKDGVRPGPEGQDPKDRRRYYGISDILKGILQERILKVVEVRVNLYTPEGRQGSSFLWEEK